MTRPFTKAKKPQRFTSVLGLVLDGSRLEGVVLKRTNGSLQQLKTFSATLSLDPLTAEPELVGREIRNHLDGAGIKERHCAFGVPLKWVLTAHTDIPEMPEEDVESFVDLEAERVFPCDSSTLQIAKSVFKTPSGHRHALLVGIPRNHLQLLEQVLRAAKLKIISFTLAINALEEPGNAETPGALAVTIGESQVGLQVTCGGGIVALRALEGAVEAEGGRRALNKDFIVREARITTAQLPVEVRESVRLIKIFGSRDLAQELADDLEIRLEAMGFTVEVVNSYEPNTFGVQLPADAVVSGAFSVAAAVLVHRPPALEFLPPRVTAWQQVASKYSSGRLAFAGGIAGAIALIVIAAFLVQQWQMVRLQNQWGAIAPKVKELQSVQQQIAQYRPWFDQNCRALVIMCQLTEAFPEDGVVTAKTVEIRDVGAVSCTGQTKDYQALLRTLEKLRASRGISEVRLSQIRGKSPMQFTFDFHWSEGGGSEN